VKTAGAVILMIAGSAGAETNDPSRAIEFLRELQASRPPFSTDLADPETIRIGPPPTMSVPKLEIKDWVKFKAGEPFKFKVIHNLPPVDGFNFQVTQSLCQLAHVTPTGVDFGSETLEKGWLPPVTYGETGTIESTKKACVNGFVCSYEVVIKEIADSPDGRFTFGPYAVSGNKGPLYDCFLEAIDRLE
jgi:hypothetical protein